MKYDPEIIYRRAKIADAWAEAPEGSLLKYCAGILMKKPYSWWVKYAKEEKEDTTTL